MRRKRGLGGSGGSGRKRRGNLSGRGGSGKDSGEGAVLGGGDDDEEPDDADDGDDGQGDEGEEEDAKPARRRSGRRSGRRSSGGDDDDEDRGFDRARQAADAEKAQMQTLLMIGIPLGLILLIVLGLAMSSGDSSHGSEDESTKGPAAIKRVDVEVDDVRRLAADAKSNMRDAMSVEGSARVTRLEQAKRSITQAQELIERKRKSVPNPAARGPTFEQLDMVEQDLNQTFVMVRKGLQEERQ